jgi:MoxR-like ATPase
MSIQMEEALPALARPQTAAVQKALAWRPNNVAADGTITGPLDLSGLIDSVESFNLVAADLNNEMIERTTEIDAMSRCIISKTHAYLFGSPGIGKSMLVRAWAHRLSLNGDFPVFMYLMGLYTKPEEVFGPVSVKGLRDDIYRYIVTNRAYEAKFILLDEFEKASTAISNSFLWLLNEREYINDGRVNKAPLQSLFAASNAQLQSESQSALGDRFLTRLNMQPLTAAGRGVLRRRRMRGRYVPQFGIATEQLDALQRACNFIYIPEDVYTALDELDGALQSGGISSKGVINSDRRWMECQAIIQATALLAGRGQADLDDLICLEHVLWNTPDERRAIAQAVGRLANPMVQRVNEWYDQAHSVYETIRAAIAKNGIDAEVQNVFKSARQLGGLLTSIEAEVKQFTASGKKNASLSRKFNEVRGWTKEMRDLAMGGQGD